MTNEIIDNIYYIGCNDHKIKLFEGQYDVPNGMSYNSYLIKDGNQIAILDCVDINFVDQWLQNIKDILKDEQPTYLVIHHVEPDHSAGISKFLKLYPNTTVVASPMAFTFLNQFYKDIDLTKKLVVKENEKIQIGKYQLTFIYAPMVHWPEVMVSYEANTKTLFTADGFGKFGALDHDEDWTCEARRYYFNIVGKYGMQVQALLNKVKDLSIARICPLHGPILDHDLTKYLDLYKIWSAYESEKNGTVIFYTSIYGHTKIAAEALAKKINCDAIDLMQYDMSEAIEKAFEYKNIVLATTTYNAGIFPCMQNFINILSEKNWQNKNIGIIGNGTWAPIAADVIKKQISSLKNMNIIEPIINIRSSLNDENYKQLDQLADVLKK
ncbi:MAG: FprA family A-type flavoprotein [Mycoplasma sp.]|nr:FprA family A-type flavoprotein [Mycoplasma sp.]